MFGLVWPRAPTGLWDGEWRYKVSYFRWRQSSELGREWDSPGLWRWFGFDFRRVWKSKEDPVGSNSPDPSGGSCLASGWVASGRRGLDRIKLPRLGSWTSGQVILTVALPTLGKLGWPWQCGEKGPVHSSEYESYSPKQRHLARDRGFEIMIWILFFLSLLALCGALTNILIDSWFWNQTAKILNPSFTILSWANSSKEFSFCLSQEEMVPSKNWTGEFNKEILPPSLPHQTQAGKG